MRKVKVVVTVTLVDNAIDVHGNVITDKVIRDRVEDCLSDLGEGEFWRPDYSSETASVTLVELEE